MLDLRHEHRVEYNKKVKAMAESLGFKVRKSYDSFTLRRLLKFSSVAREALLTNINTLH